MVPPGARVLRLYWPVRCSATPQAEIAPVHEVSVVGFGFCASGSGMLVLMIQSALPAVSASVSSNRTRWVVVAAGAAPEGAVAGAATAGEVAAGAVDVATELAGQVAAAAAASTAAAAA